MIMSQQKRNKLNLLLQEWPKGTVATTLWLKKRGIQRDLLARYRSSNWVQKIGNGAVVRTGDAVEWPGAVYALQEQLFLTVHPGGKTALALQGAAHFIPMGKERVMVYTGSKERLPKWFTACDWKINLFIYKTNIFPSECTVGLKKIKMGDFDIVISAPERAMFEVLHNFPFAESPDETSYLMEGLATLRPEVVQTLLEQCSSIWVKRLFMVQAEMAKHPWLQRINLSRIDFGKGKRSLVKNGYLHPKYHLTIPRSWKTGEGEF